MKELIERLKCLNEWRRGAEIDMPDPKQIGKDIDRAIELLEDLRWRDVIRDKHGFATCECLNEILNHEQVLFLMNDGAIDAMSKNHDKTGWRGEIERNVDYVKYRPIETI